jgi:HAD superfamily hydrolase (TIGR01662 family)
MPETKAVIFDVDFTLIYPGPVFRGEGYQAFSKRHQIDVNPAKFESAVASAASLLDDSEGSPYDHELFVAYTRHIIEAMGGKESGSDTALDACAREIYAECGRSHHFEMYDDVEETLRALTNADVRIALISNSHRPLDEFQSHFELRRFISAAVSSADHGYMKPHPSIFLSALADLDVAPRDAVMVGDSLRHDVEGALNIGMRAVWLNRGDNAAPTYTSVRDTSVPVIRSLRELPALIIEGEVKIHG